MPPTEVRALVKTPRRNDQCPCGSGLKYKRCCLDAASGAVPPAAEDRMLVLQVLNKLSHGLLADDRAAALDEFWRNVPGTWQLTDEQQRTADLTFDGWFWHDRRGPSGRTPTEMLLERSPLADGPRAYLERLSGSVMELWNVTDVQPGVSLTLLSSSNRREVTVFESSASRLLQPGVFIAARINPLGVSGSAEIDLGCVQIPDAMVRPLEDRLREHSDAFESEHPGAPPRDWLKSLPPVFNEMWIRTQVEGL